MDRFSHVDDKGRANMVDVSDKVPQRRIARATGSIVVSQATAAAIAENNMKKGDVLTVAQIAGIQAAKRTAELIPLCHPLILDAIDVQLELNADSVVATSEVACVGRTGAEMEALAAVTVALLTVYDMCKALDKNMRIGDIVLLQKEKHDVEKP
jgi:cyclic pyranopterin monophosphate synthase